MIQVYQVVMQMTNTYLPVVDTLQIFQVVDLVMLHNLEFLQVVAETLRQDKLQLEVLYNEYNKNKQFF